MKSLLFLLALQTATSAVTSADAEQIRAVIHSEIGALRLCDRPVHQPASVSFLGMVVMSGDVVQPVQVTEGGGAVWVAYYAMQRQGDGTWRTSACRLVQPGRTISA